jgi:hypothetical protein
MPSLPTSPVVIKGIAVDSNVFESRPIRLCRIDECQSHCCGGGVYINIEQARDILAHAPLIQPHLPEARRDPNTWFDWTETPETDHPAGGVTIGTNILPDPTHPEGTTCIFLRPDRKCALQAAGIAEGEHPWRFKPFYCALHPISFSEHVLGLAEGNEMFKDGGHCSRPADQAVPLYRLYADELKFVLGEEGYGELVALAEGPQA